MGLPMGLGRNGNRRDIVFLIFHKYAFEIS